MRYSKLKICCILLAGLATANATTLQEAIQQLTGEAAKKYVGPIVSGIGADLNAGWYHRAPPAKKFQFTLEGGLLAMGSMLDGGTKSFNVNQNFRFTAERLRQTFCVDNRHINLFPGESLNLVDDTLFN